MVFKDEEIILADASIQAAGVEEEIINAKNNIINATNGTGEVFRNQKTFVLQWMFMMYKNMATNSMVIIDTLKDAEIYTGSRLEADEIKKTIEAVNRIDMGILTENLNLNKFFDAKNMSSLNEISLFKDLKKKGLRSIEDDLYEYGLRVKNCKDADEAYVILRAINSRLGILEDYIANEDLKESERAHWERICDSYREFRLILSKKKFKEKSWGIFIDYNELDKLDKKEDDE
jgi:hypothetical protein